MSEQFLGALEAYLSIRSSQTGRQYRSIARDWSKFIRSDPLTATESDIWRFIAAQKKVEGQKSRIDGSTEITWSTIQRKLIILKAVYNHLMATNLVKINPFQPQQFTKKGRIVPKRPTEAIDFNDVGRLISIPGKYTKEAIRDTAILTVFFAGALRRSEVIGLKLRDICFTKAGTLFLRLENTKAGKVQEQAIAEWAVKDIQDCYEMRQKEGALPRDPLFSMYRLHKTATHTHLSDKTIERLFYKYRDIAGLPETITTHSCRATAITKLLSDGMSYRDVQEFSRHASVTRVEVYDKRHFSPDSSPAKKLSFG